MAVVYLGVTVIHAARALRPQRRVHSLWAGPSIINFAIQCAGERTLGVEATSFVFRTSYITDAFDVNLSRWSSNRWLKSLLPWGVLLWACWRFDRIHLFPGCGLLPGPENRSMEEFEFRCYRRLSIDVFFWTCGADVRTRSATEAMGWPNCCVQCPRPGFHCVCLDDRAERNLRLVRKYARQSFSMGDMIDYVPGSRTDTFFWPIAIEAEGGEKYRPVYPMVESQRPVRIVHAPNHRHFKGTNYLLEAVEKLKAEGASLELVLVEGVPNKEALKIYRSADIVFDQCLIGFHGYFANEAMALGKPVCVFVRRPEAYLLDPDACPLVNTPPSRLLPVLRELVSDRQRLHDLGRRGRAYIETYHTPEAFAGRLAKVYRSLSVRVA